MRKRYIAELIQESTDIMGVTANQAIGDLMTATVKELKKDQGLCAAWSRYVQGCQDQSPQGRKQTMRTCAAIMMH